MNLGELLEKAEADLKLCVEDREAAGRHYMLCIEAEIESRTEVARRERHIDMVAEAYTPKAMEVGDD